MTTIDIVKLMIKKLNKSEDLIVYVTDSKGHDLCYAIDPSKLYEGLCWLPETKFANGIMKMIQWYQNNKDLVGRDYFC